MPKPSTYNTVMLVPLPMMQRHEPAFQNHLYRDAANQLREVYRDAAGQTEDRTRNGFIVLIGINWRRPTPESLENARDRHIVPAPAYRVRKAFAEKHSFKSTSYIYAYTYVRGGKTTTVRVSYHTGRTQIVPSVPFYFGTVSSRTTRSACRTRSTNRNAHNKKGLDPGTTKTNKIQNKYKTNRQCVADTPPPDPPCLVVLVPHQVD